MTTTSGIGDHRGQSIEIKPILLPVCCPRFVNGAGLLGRGDTESSERQDHRANADVMLRALANMPAFRAFQNWTAEMPLGPDSLEH
jgi:hypothetical protein